MVSFNLTQGPSNVFAAILTAITGLIAVILGYKFNVKKQEQDHLVKCWEELSEENTKFREEVRKDLQFVKEERDRLVLRVNSLDINLSQVMRENLELKRKEIEFTSEIKNLKEENVELKSRITEQDKEIALLKEKANEPVRNQ
jgi:hypothetical protein